MGSWWSGVEMQEAGAFRPPTTKTRLSYLTVQRDPGVVYWPSVFLEALGYQGQQTTHFPEQSGFVGLAAEGGKAKQPFFI